jgi:4-hydroxybenzoate polyprenyltransferase
MEEALAPIVNNLLHYWAFTHVKLIIGFICFVLGFLYFKVKEEYVIGGLLLGFGVGVILYVVGFATGLDDGKAKKAKPAAAPAYKEKTMTIILDDSQAPKKPK